MMTDRAGAQRSRAQVGYIIERMERANERLLTAQTPDQRIRAAQWVVAWSIAAGADAPDYMKLRKRPPGAAVQRALSRESREQD